MSTHETSPTRTEKVLAYSALAIIAAAIISFFATLIAALVGVERATLAQGFWPVVTWIGYVGLPIGFILIITLLTMTMRRRKQDRRGSTR